MRAGAFLIVEGLFALYYAELLPLYQLRVYVDTPDEVCFERRHEAGCGAARADGRVGAAAVRSDGAAIEPADTCGPRRVHADLMVDGTEALDWKVEQVLAALRTRGMLRMGA